MKQIGRSPQQDMDEREVQEYHEWLDRVHEELMEKGEIDREEEICFPEENNERIR